MPPRLAPPSKPTRDTFQSAWDHHQCPACRKLFAWVPRVTPVSPVAEPDGPFYSRFFSLSNIAPTRADMLFASHITDERGDWISQSRKPVDGHGAFARVGYLITQHGPAPWHPCARTVGWDAANVHMQAQPCQRADLAKVNCSASSPCIDYNTSCPRQRCVAKQSIKPASSD